MEIIPSKDQIMIPGDEFKSNDEKIQKSNPEQTLLVDNCHYLNFFKPSKILPINFPKKHIPS